MTVNDALNFAWPFICGVSALGGLWLSARLYPATRKVETKIEHPADRRSLRTQPPR